MSEGVSTLSATAAPPGTRLRAHCPFAPSVRAQPRAKYATNAMANEQEAFNMFRAKGGGVLFIDFLGWGLSPNAFSDGTRAAIHRTCERYARLLSVTRCD